MSAIPIPPEAMARCLKARRFDSAGVEQSLLYAISNNPFWISDVYGYYEEVHQTNRAYRVCDGCKSFGMRCLFSQDGVDKSMDNFDLCPLCLVNLQRGADRVQSIKHATEAELHHYDEKFANAVFVPNNGSPVLECPCCRKDTRSYFKEGERIACPVCYVATQHGSLFVDDIVDVFEQHYSRACRRQDGVTQADIDLFYDFIDQWDGTGDAQEALTSFVQDRQRPRMIIYQWFPDYHLPPTA